VLHSGLQGGGKRPNKWIRRSRIAIYMGFSPRHARSVALVLSLTTGYMSPQFHVKYDDFFETVQDSKSLPRSKWQFLSWFVTNSSTSNNRPAQPSVPSQGASQPASQSRPSQAVAPESDDPLGFDFVDPDNNDSQEQVADDNTEQQTVTTDH
jgi:hypothetical protein